MRATCVPPDGDRGEKCVRGDSEKENPPGVLAGGSHKCVSAGAGSAGADFATAFLAVLQARSRVYWIIAAANNIRSNWRTRQVSIEPDMRGEVVAIFREAYEVYRACFCSNVRQHFEKLTGESFGKFEDAIVLVGEEIWGDAHQGARIFSAITPEALDE